jgi:hypothetical protein
MHLLFVHVHTFTRREEEEEKVRVLALCEIFRASHGIDAVISLRDKEPNER